MEKGVEEGQIVYGLQALIATEWNFVRGKFRCVTCGSETESSLSGVTHRGESRGGVACAECGSVNAGGRPIGSGTVGVKVGDRMGSLEAVEPTRLQSDVTLWRCTACGQTRKVSMSMIRMEVNAKRLPACLKCRRAARNAKRLLKEIARPPRIMVPKLLRLPKPLETKNSQADSDSLAGHRCKPVKEGEIFGRLAATSDIPSRGATGQFRCVQCGAFHETSATAAKAKGDRSCGICTPSRRRMPRLSEDERKARQAASKAKYRVALKAGRRSGRLIYGSQCQHEKELICVDPGNVEIWRCRACQMTGEPAWTVPLFDLGKTFRERPNYDGDSSPSFENMIRILEDFSP